MVRLLDVCMTNDQWLLFIAMGIYESNIYLSLFMSNESLCNSGSRVRDAKKCLGPGRSRSREVAEIKRASRESCGAAMFRGLCWKSPGT